MIALVGVPAAVSSAALATASRCRTVRSAGPNSGRGAVPAARRAAARSRPRPRAVLTPGPRGDLGGHVLEQVPVQRRRGGRLGRAEDREPRRREQVAQQHHARRAGLGDRPHAGSGERDHLVPDAVEQHAVLDLQQLHHAGAAATGEARSRRK
ncbi:hypothetical protein [Amycolatopsis australiensis]|uniref:hypothetical protein n=1 Tax=Amycolatopsis australiensis TaxID=546364 RepID=UPI000931C293|nr:hypothetical protein [Amycolatopsis australiensis]